MEFVRKKFDEEETDFDFFRFRAIRKNPLNPDLKRAIRIKFRFALQKFIRRYQKGQTDLPRPLKLIKEA